MVRCGLHSTSSRWPSADKMLGGSGAARTLDGSAATAARGEIGPLLALTPVMRVSKERFLRENESYSWFLITVYDKLN